MDITIKNCNNIRRGGNPGRSVRVPALFPVCANSEPKSALSYETKKRRLGSIIETGRRKRFSEIQDYRSPSLYFLMSFWILSVGDREFPMETSWFKELMMAAMYLLISASTYHSFVKSSGER